MHVNHDLSITEETFRRMLSLKIKSGFDEKGWDEWFDYLFNRAGLQKLTQNEIEETMEKIQYKNYDEWVQNFALNLNNIWNEFSAKELSEIQNFSSERSQTSAIVIGRGPSVKKKKHLELIAKSEYKGSIVCTDGILADALRAGVTPSKFPKFYVVTIDPYVDIKKFYDDPIIDKYGEKIKGIFTTIANPYAVERARKSRMKIYWMHTLFDYDGGKKSFNQTSALMVRAKNHKHGLPAIQTGGNVGTSAWFVSWRILKCSVIALTGINHGWDEDDPWDVIVSHGRPQMAIGIDKDTKTTQKLFPKIYNPYFDCYCILDPLFQFYSTALKEFIARSPSWVTTINATEGGCIFGERIKCITLVSFLKEYTN